MTFVAITSTEDGRITAGKTYDGMLIYKPIVASGNTVEGRGMRIAVYDNRFEWMTFNPKAFRPQMLNKAGKWI